MAGSSIAVRAQTSSPLVGQIQTSLSSEQRAKISYDAYILGPGDSLQIDVLDLPEFSGTVSIGPDGTIYLPRLRALYVEGLTIEELRLFLTEQYKAYIRYPELYIRPIRYRPIRIYVGGEVKRPGYYTLSGDNELSRLSDSAEAQQLQNGTATAVTRPGLNQAPDGQSIRSGASNLSTFGQVFPTIFDAIRTAQGITPYSDLAQVQVTRRQAISSGGGRLRANLNFLSLITEGDESQNIRLFDGDVVSVGKSPTVLREQLLKAGQTNLTPQFLQVYVSGRVEQPGAVTLPQGSSLVQAIDLAGGTKVLHGKVEFIRFTREGEIDRRIFGFKSDAPSGDYRNPVLMAGDVVRLRETALTKSLAVVNEITTPAIGIYSVYSLFDGFSN
jgi:polysaccharide export outer membrane protein